MEKFDLYIRGQTCKLAGGEYFESFDPCTGKPWAMVAKGGAADVERAVQAAHQAFKSPAWRGITATARGALLRKLADVIAVNAERLGRIETRDNGKLLAEMQGQVRYIPQWFHYYGGLADKIEGSVIPVDKAKMFTFTEYEPLGVVAAITPWNSPLLLAAWKLAPAPAAKGLKPVTLELGGKSPNIVFADANIDNAVKGVISGIVAARARPALLARVCWCSARSTMKK